MHMPGDTSPLIKMSQIHRRTARRCQNPASTPAIFPLRPSRSSSHSARIPRHHCNTKTHPPTRGRHRALEGQRPRRAIIRLLCLHTIYHISHYDAVLANSATDEATRRGGEFHRGCFVRGAGHVGHISSRLAADEVRRPGTSQDIQFPERRHLGYQTR